MTDTRDWTGRVIAKSLDEAKMVARSYLTWPTVDQDGDFVRPDGGDWGKFRAHPLVNWWHEFPVGRGSVTMESVATEDGREWDVPVGTTRFFRTERDTKGLALTVRDPATYAPVGKLTQTEAVAAAHDAWRMVAEGAAAGVSMEFLPDGRHTRDTGGRSPHSGRPSRRYDRWTGLGWAHTPRPVNPNARVFDVGDAVTKALSIASSGRFPGGQAVSPVLLKSLSRLAGEVGRPESVTGGWDGGTQDDTPPADPAPDDAPAEEERTAAQLWAAHLASDLTELTAACRGKLAGLADDPFAAALVRVCDLMDEGARVALSIYRGSSEPAPEPDPEPELKARAGPLSPQALKYGLPDVFVDEDGETQIRVGDDSDDSDGADGDDGGAGSISITAEDIARQIAESVTFGTYACDNASEADAAAAEALRPVLAELSKLSTRALEVANGELLTKSERRQLERVAKAIKRLSREIRRDTRQDRRRALYPPITYSR